jgi:hypothetical protein
LWGIDGAAAATLLSYMLYFLLLLGYLWWRMKVNLFSASQLKVLVLMAAGYGLNLLWTNMLTPIIIPHPSRVALLVDAVLKTAVLALLLAVAVYAWRVSPTVNSIVDRKLRKEK